MRSFFTRVACAVSIGAGLVLVAPVAQAHFVLEAPPSWSVDNQNSGMPEKLGPCGNEGTPVVAIDDAGKPIVTAFQEGGMITVTIDEVVFHPGHYRISLSTDWADAGDTVQAGFPPDPLVTVGTTPCGSVPIEMATPVAVPGVGWILADNVFPHTQQFTKPQTAMIPLPPGVTCNECVIQVLEFMGDHPLNVPGGCFYHHCANVSISGTGSTGGSGASASGSMSSGVSSGVASGGSSGAVGSTGAVASTGAAGTGSSTTGSVGTTGAVGTSGSAAASGSMGTTGAGSSAGSMASTGTGVTPPASGSATAGGGSGGTMAPPTTTTKTGCSISPRGAPFGGGLLGLVVAAGLIRRKRR